MGVGVHVFWVLHSGGYCWTEPLMVVLVLVDGRSVDSMMEACLYSIACRDLFVVGPSKQNVICVGQANNSIEQNAKTRCCACKQAKRL
jgi:hypothetical protein